MAQISPYSNIPSFLSTKSKGKNSIFIKNKNGSYTLQRKLREEINVKIGLPKKTVPSNNLFPTELLIDTRGYIQNIASQAILCYDYGLYDASLVMMRKLIETLITLNPQLHSRSATYIKRNGLLIRKITIKSSRPFQCAYHPLTP